MVAKRVFSCNTAWEMSWWTASWHLATYTVGLCRRNEFLL